MYSDNNIPITTCMSTPSVIFASRSIPMPKLILNTPSENQIDSHEQLTLAQILFPLNPLEKEISFDNSNETLIETLNSLKNSILSQKYPNESIEKSRRHHNFVLSKSETGSCLINNNIGNNDSGRSSVKDSYGPCDNERSFKNENEYICTKVERIRKIKKYKEKLAKWRKVHPISRKFEGRRKVAFEKRRKNGRFSKQS